MVTASSRFHKQVLKRIDVMIASSILKVAASWSRIIETVDLPKGVDIRITRSVGPIIDTYSSNEALVHHALSIFIAYNFINLI